MVINQVLIRWTADYLVAECNCSRAWIIKSRPQLRKFNVAVLVNILGENEVLRRGQEGREGPPTESDDWLAAARCRGAASNLVVLVTQYFPFAFMAAGGWARFTANVVLAVRWPA